MLRINELYWIAGILEGEGNFRIGTTSPAIALQMTYDTHEYKLIRSIMKSRKCNEEEAKKLINNLKSVN